MDFTKNMKWLRKLNPDLLFILFVIAYLLTRQWPYGGTMQTVADVSIAVALVRLAVKFFIGKKPRH